MCWEASLLTIVEYKSDWRHQETAKHHYHHHHHHHHHHHKGQCILIVLVPRAPTMDHARSHRHVQFSDRITFSLSGGFFPDAAALGDVDNDSVGGGKLVVMMMMEVVSW